MTQIGLLLVLLNVMAVCLGVDFPIDMSEFVTRVIRSVFCELDRETVIRAFVKSGDKSFNN